jgi:hypothetical protein
MKQKKKTPKNHPFLISERHVQKTNRDGRATDPAKAKCRGGSPGGIILGAGHGEVIGWLFGVCL